MSGCKKFIPRNTYGKNTYTLYENSEKEGYTYTGKCGLTKSGKCCKYGTNCANGFTKIINCTTLNKEKCNDLNADKSFLANCCKCEDKSLRPKKGGSINLTKEQAKQLIQQIGGNSIKSTYVSYNGNDAKILGYNKQTKNLILQTGYGLENISVNNLLVNGKSII